MDYILKIIPSIQQFAFWYIVAYAFVMFAMTIDLITGVQKAKQLGIARTSTGYKMTCDKASKYFLPMLCLSGIDLLASTLLPVPAFTMLLAAFNIFCEWKSIMESTHDKAELRDAAKTMDVVIKNRDDLTNAIAEAVKTAFDVQGLTQTPSEGETSTDTGKTANITATLKM